jgi:DNA-directed RNA polymerase III subunit RPC2
MNNVTGSELHSPGSFIVYMNGNILGLTRLPDTFVGKLRLLRRSGIISEFISVYVNLHQQAVHIASDGGRICRPMIIVENGAPRVRPHHIQVRIAVPPPKAAGLKGWGTSRN